MGLSHARGVFRHRLHASQGVYFGEVVDDAMRLNAYGEMIRSTWREIPSYYQGIGTDAFVVMPNHVHGIIFIESVGAIPRGRPKEMKKDVHSVSWQAQGPVPTTLGLSEVIKRFKTMTMHRYRKGVIDGLWEPYDQRLWQRGFYNHIIRNDSGLDAVRGYVRDNPLQWALDCENPGASPLHSGDHNVAEK